MSPGHEASLSALDERAEGLAEQLTSLSLPVLTKKYDRGTISPQATITAPASFTQSLFDAASNDLDLAEQLAESAFEKAKDRIKVVMKCKSVDIYRSDGLESVQPGQAVKLTVQTFF